MIATRIRQARVAAGMTQQETVDALAHEGVALTKAGLSKYERGGSTPKATVLRSLARVWGVETSYFLEQPTTQVEWLAFRKAARLSASRQARVMALAEAQLEVFLTLRDALEPARTDDLPPRKRVTQPQHAEDAAQSLRDHWRLGDQPIDSVTSAIEDGGGIVVESGGEDDLFDGLSGWVNQRVPVVVVSVAVSDDRRRFSLAHELGHLFMDVGTTSASTEEKLAHRFAAAFLVTAATARRELGERRRHLDLRELMMLKQKHGLSMQAWILRAADLDIIDQAHARTLFTELSSRGWRRHEPVEFHGQERPARLRQLAVRALAEGLLTRSQAERICPDMASSIEETTEERRGPLDARSLVRLSKKERDRLLRQAAALVADEYENDGSLADLESLAEEDHLDDSGDD